MLDTLPADLSGVTYLQDLRLDGHVFLGGTLPLQLSTLSMRSLTLTGGAISGKLPPEWSAWGGSLVQLHLGNMTSLTGVVGGLGRVNSHTCEVGCSRGKAGRQSWCGWQGGTSTLMRVAGRDVNPHVTRRDINPDALIATPPS